MFIARDIVYSGVSVGVPTTVPLILVFSTRIYIAMFYYVDTPPSNFTEVKAAIRACIFE